MFERCTGTITVGYPGMVIGVSSLGSLMRPAFCLLLLGITACVGKAPPNNAQPDAAVDAPPGETTLMLSGKTVDYFGNVALEGVAIATDGIEPAQSAVSDPAGLYEVPLLVGSKIYLVAAKTGYRLTRSTQISVAADPIMQDAYVLSVQDIRNQYTSAGATPVANTAFVVAELRRNNNTPLEVPLANIQLLDSNNQPAQFKGPFAFNAAGNVDPAATTVAAFGGRARIALLDVPAGTYTLNVTYPNNNGGTQTNSTSVLTTEEGATLVLSGGSQGSGTGGGSADPSFATDIYPKLQRAASGGLGCANCHTLSGTAAVLKYDDPAATVLTNMKARVGVINATVPADSLLLKRPLYEPPPAMQDHPNATFIDTNDADYKLFLLWISNGAKP